MYAVDGSELGKGTGFDLGGLYCAGHGINLKFKKLKQKIKINRVKL